MSPVKAASPILTAAGTASKPTGPGRVREAAEQFEALLMGQILRNARETNGSSSDCAIEFGW